MSDGARSYGRSVTSSLQFCVGLATVRLQWPRFAPDCSNRTDRYANILAFIAWDDPAAVVSLTFP
jgi:hypothetical protein